MIEAEREPRILECIRADWAHYPTHRALMATVFGFVHLRALLMHRIAHSLRRRGIPFLPNLVRYISLSLHGCDINPSAKLGPGFRMTHTVGVVIGGDVRTGRNCVVFQNTTMGGGGRTVDGRTQPLLGDNVWLYAGAVLSGPVIIGDNAQIGANSVVLDDIPANSFAAGAPARVKRSITPSDFADVYAVL